jgi:hypothetical protein
MAKRIEPTGQPVKARAKSRTRAKLAEPQVISSTVTKSVRQVGEPLEEEPGAAAPLRDRIALAAYFLAERRQFVPGHEEEDWLTAEAMIKQEANLQE